jgi:hypothetical protein
MLTRSVPERALGAMFGSELTTEVLQRYLVNLSKDVVAYKASVATVAEARNKKKEEEVSAQPALKLDYLRRELLAGIQKDIDQRTGRSFRTNECESAAKRICDRPFLEQPEIPALDETIDTIMEIDGCALHFKNVQIKRYTEILSELDPTLLAAWHLGNRLQDRRLEKRAMLTNSIAELTTLLVGPRFLSLPFAENHVHLAGISGNEIVLAQIVLGHSWPIPDQASPAHVSRLRRIRRMLVAFVDIWNEDDKAEPYLPDERMFDLLQACNDEAEPVAPNPTIDWDFVERGIAVEGEEEVEPEHWKAPATAGDKQPVTGRWLLRRLASAARKQKLQQAWTWLFVLLLRIYRAKAVKPAIRAIVLLVIADIMVLRRQLTMDGNGLRRFTSQVFHSPLRKEAASHETWRETQIKDTAQCLFVHAGDKAEIKISITALLSASQAVQFARAAKSRFDFLSGGPGCLHEHARSHWHLCAHFNRVAKVSRADLWRLAVSFSKILHSEQNWELAPSVSSLLDDKHGHAISPAKLVRGLDVVGDETRQPIEWVAPMLRWLRHLPSSHHRLDETMERKPLTPKLHLSIHAGEDYAHPLSGLRHIDETVRFCEMQAADRLGHALALGISPDNWLQRHGDVFLSVDDHVDNLIWAWREAVKLRRLKEAQQVRPRFIARIVRMLPHVSWYPCKDEMSAPTLSDLRRLHKAWALRRNCAYKALSETDDMEVGGSKLEVGVPDLARIRLQLNNPSIDTAEGLYVLRARLAVKSPTASSKPVRQVRLTVPQHGCITRAQQHLESSDSTDYLHDHDDVHDLRFMLALQDACIERYARLGLAIESNPSSNVYIGQLQSHSEHPIYRWAPPDPLDLAPGGKCNLFGLRTIPIPVTINTDDPGVIPTTLRMEHHIMHEAAIDRGHSEIMADEWIEQIRRTGMQFFEAAH